MSLRLPKLDTVWFLICVPGPFIALALILVFSKPHDGKPGIPHGSGAYEVEEYRPIGRY